jgi:HD-GYP domain-containing protein (c-di-GMP phosphodiesterase class II)
VPAAAVAVHAHRTRPGWIVALSLRPGRTFDATDVRMIGLAGAMLFRQLQHLRSQADVKESLLGLVRCLTALIEAKDSCTAGHSERVSRIAVRVGQQMGLDQRTLSDLHLSGLLHDVGKVGVRDEVLLKPGRLTAEEEAHLQEHPVIGDQIVGTIKPFQRLRAGVRSHHERFAGGGYPDGLAGEAIPLIARILAVADACDALMSARRYRGPMAPPEIDALLRKLAGVQWDPEVVENFMLCRHDIYPPIYRKGIGDSGIHSIEALVGGLKEGSSSYCRLADPPSR